MKSFITRTGGAVLWRRSSDKMHKCREREETTPATSGALPVLAGRPTDGLPCRIAVRLTAPRACRTHLPRSHLAFARAQEKLIDTGLRGHNGRLVVEHFLRPPTRSGARTLIMRGDHSPRDHHSCSLMRWLSLSASATPSDFPCRQRHAALSHLTSSQPAAG
jgi:hypothetical protein